MAANRTVLNIANRGFDRNAYLLRPHPRLYAGEGGKNLSFALETQEITSSEET